MDRLSDAHEVQQQQNMNDVALREEKNDVVEERTSEVCG